MLGSEAWRGEDGGVMCVTFWMVFLFPLCVRGVMSYDGIAAACSETRETRYEDECFMSGIVGR